MSAGYRRRCHIQHAGSKGNDCLYPKSQDERARIRLTTVDANQSESGNSQKGLAYPFTHCLTAFLITRFPIDRPCLRTCYASDSFEAAYYRSPRYCDALEGPLARMFRRFVRGRLGVVELDNDARMSTPLSRVSGR